MTGCTKRRYDTRWVAGLALRAVQRKSEALGRKPPTGSYLCGSCRGWHLTSKSKSQVPPWAKRASA